MAKVTYDAKSAPNDGLPEDTTQFGYEFVGTQPVEVTNPAHLRKFAGHPHFKVSGTVPQDASVVRTGAERESAALGNGSAEAVNAAPVVQPVLAQPEPGPARVTPGQADAPDGDTDLRAVHRGRGVYAVMRGDKDQEVIEGLSKEDAEAFNNLSAADKLAYVTAPAK